jgi:hypothetical protein
MRLNPWQSQADRRPGKHLASAIDKQVQRLGVGDFYLKKTALALR